MIWKKFKWILLKNFLQITGLMVGCCKNPVLNLPIAIGSYPFQNDIIVHPACEYYNLSTRSDISSSFQLSSSTFSNSTNQIVCSMSAYQNSAYRPLDSYINDGKLRPKKKNWNQNVSIRFTFYSISTDPPTYDEIMHTYNFNSWTNASSNQLEEQNSCT